METAFDYRQFAILYVDDEVKSLKLFARAFGETFRVLTAVNARDGLQMLQESKEPVGLLMTDQRMPGEKGVWLLEKARQLQPRIIRILVTAYTDMDATIAAVNSGAIYKYVGKPWDPVQLEHTLKRGLEFFAVQRERDQLLKERMSVLRNAMIADRVMSLGLMAAGLSHHIRNPLVAVKTFLDLAPAKMEEEKAEIGGAVRNAEFWEEYHHSAQGQIQKINDLLRALVSASENPGSQFGDRVSLREVLDQVSSALQANLTAGGIRVENNVPASLPALQVDSPKFCRLFELLLRDEIASLPPGSTVRCSAKVLSAEAEASPEIEVCLQDDGPGLPQETLRLVFNPFLVRSDSPMEYGINLIACYFIVHHHGGTIQAQNEHGQGTTFTIRLPVNPQPAVAIGEAPDFFRKVFLNEMQWEKLASE